ncbi:ABC-F family ATP-binding cassette domain-containing protein [Azospirillum sp. YIM DDC1]|uniref:ABC-F family ATP-binding cassette domain-containing protein n=1 Tax=Azospirillum aestuarii TaxID=2802052 RepID=A0ABS1HRY7_9PROT|nr:ABC-F family ATP-binding cassette domain-containing protein [Azospirillum aestuarii]MBK4717506.1 ABC-F family ATP-binding cassette domain-containing protein [Azospirillum aestuarii]TWA93361.1 ATP-binding cassette subfamily F protein 3 [Azospirillum brasilense]
MLHINDLTFRYGGRVLFDRATAVVSKGHRVALVGRNGTGKSTLLKLIAGQLQTDAGAIGVPTGTKIGMVAQEAPSGATTLIDAVLAADTERTALLAEAETATDPMRIGEIHARLADIEAHSAPSRAAQVLSGLGFDADAQARPCSDFSGGWRMRVALAGVLFARPDLLLLDEPTNHLDLEATIWLEGYLKNYPHTILLVSHDRDLLNSVPTTTIHVDQGRLVTYAGNYDQFLKQRRANMERLQAMATKQEAKRKHMMAFVERFRYKATKARQAQSRLKALEKLETITLMEDDAEVVFNFPQPDEMPPPLISLDGVTIGYGDRAILRRVNLRIDMDDRIALLGANGNGKSTLVKLLAGRLEAMAGEVKRPTKLRVGYFAQHQQDELDLSLTPIQQTQRIMPLAPEEKVRAHLGRFGFQQSKAETRISDLSGGEKARLLLALMSRETPHILMLDEPTNHLDVDSREALIEAINGFEGAVILISHDPHLIELTADRLLLVADGTVQPYDGDLDDYRRFLLDRARAERAAAKGGEATDAGASRKDQRRAAAEARATLAPLKKKATDAESQVNKLTEEKRKIEAKLADPALYSGPSDKLRKLQIDLGVVDKKLSAAEEAWLEHLEAYESAAAEAGV